MTYEQIRDLIDELEFHGTGDETYEMFQATCQLCYLMAGVGDMDKATTLAYWAREQADASREFCVGWYPDGDYEKAKGHFG